MNIQKYESIFYHQLAYYFTNDLERELYQKKFKNIRPSIEETIKFIDSYKFGDNQEDITIRAISVLPFMLTDTPVNLNLEARRMYRKMIAVLEFIKKEKFMANHLISSATTNKKDNTPIVFDDF